VAALGRVPAIGAGDGEQAVREIDVGLAESDELTLSKACVDRRREQRAPPVRKRCEDRRYLLGAEEVRDLPRDLALLHVSDWVRPAEALG